MRCSFVGALALFSASNFFSSATLFAPASIAEAGNALEKLTKRPRAAAATMLGRANDVDSGCAGMAEAGLATKSVGAARPAVRGPVAAHGTKVMDGATPRSKAAAATA